MKATTDEKEKLFVDKLKAALSKILRIKDTILSAGNYEFFTCVTSLSKLNFEKGETASQRVVYWHPLPKFCARTFLKLHVPLKEHSGVIEKIANFCGNYPRAVKKCLETLLHKINDESFVYQYNKDEILANIFIKCEEYLEGQYKEHWQEIETKFIFLLLGVKVWGLTVKQIKLGTVSYTPNWLMRHGFTFAHKDEITPQTISPIMLYCMLKVTK